MSFEPETMTLNMPAREMRMLEALAKHHGMSKIAVMRQALRVYQLIHFRLREGETMSFSGDRDRPTIIAAVGLGEP